jgi:hypothetical protein
MPHAQSPHRPSSADTGGEFDHVQSDQDAFGDTFPPSKDAFCAPLSFHAQNTLLSLSPRLPSEVPLTATSVPEPAPSNDTTPHANMSLDEHEPMQWTAPTNFLLSSMAQHGAGYNASNPFPPGTGDFYHYAENGMSYHDNFTIPYPAQYPSSSCPRSYNGVDLSGLPADITMTDSFPPTAYHIEPPKHNDAMDLADQEINGQLMQLSNDYDHHPYGSHIKVEDPNGYQSPYSDLTRASTPHDDTPRHHHDLSGDGGVIDKEQPYAQLIYQALLNAPNKTMILRDIYEWFKSNTDKASASETKGWQNSIRHNLSMNGVSKVIPPKVLQPNRPRPLKKSTNPAKNPARASCGA